MSEFIRLILVAGLIVLVCLLAIFVAKTLIDDAAEWLDRRSCQRAQRIEHELAKTKKVLALVSHAQASLLDAQAHEAAVALILESYRASHSPADPMVVSPRQ